MIRLFIIMLIYMLIACYYTYSQNINNVNNLSDIWESLGLDTEESEAFEDLYDDLSYLLEYPVNLTGVTREELNVFPFLTDEQIDAILDYPNQYGEMVSVYELKNIEELDYVTLRLLIPFVSIAENFVDNRLINVHNLLKYGRNELVIRYDKGFQQKKGYLSLSDSVLASDPNKKYLGEPFYTSFRYSYSYDTKIQAGLVAEKDAGEPFRNQYHKGYDYYSFHLLLKDINRFKTIVVGDYKATFGQGLIFSQDFTPGRTAVVTQVDRRKNGFRRHYSTNEYDYLRGAAVTCSFSSVDVNIFYSSRRMDGITDSIYIQSIKKDGIHRTQREQERKNVFSLNTYGGNIRYATPDLVIGLTGVMTSFGNHSFSPEENPYNLYYFRGNRNINTGVDYLWKNRYIKMFGETAWSQNGGWATLQGLQITPVSYAHFIALYRYYDKRYYAFYGKAFSQQSQLQNEEGVYMGIRLSPVPFWKISAYADLFRFPWLRYSVDAPSKGKEYMIQLDHTVNSVISLYLRYRHTRKEKNRSIEKTNRIIDSYSQQKIQLQMKMEEEEWQMKTSGEYSFYSFDNSFKGWIISHSMGWKPLHLPVKIDIFGSCFRTEDYTIRFRSAEKNLLYAFYSPFLYGKGFRLSTVFQWEIIRKLLFTCKIGHTHYFDRDKIGSGLEEIDGNKKTDINIQLKWKF